jgi:uncharacterized protein
MVIDLDNGLKTNARLNLPATGDGPFPAVLMIRGASPGGIETTGQYEPSIDFETGSIEYPPAAPFFQITEYLSERGFAVLQYDKRGIDTNQSFINYSVWANVTFDDLKHDAEKALDVLIQQAEVDPERVSIVGYSEGTMITPRVAIDNTGKVDNIVLMGSVAQNLRDVIYFQKVTMPVLYAQQVLVDTTRKE